MNHGRKNSAGESGRDMHFFILFFFQNAHQVQYADLDII